MDCRSAIGQVLLHFVAFVILSNVASKVEGCHLSCDFEESLCDYEQSTDDDGDWKRVTGENPTSDTGPSSDHTTGGGSYVYFESPDPEKEGEFADLRGPIVQDFRQECLGFYYHMKGSDMDSLEVLTYKDKDGSARYNQIWMKEGQQSKNNTDWKHAELTITEFESYQLIFRATKGSKYKSDIALDDISLFHTACVGPCDSNPCGEGGVCITDDVSYTCQCKIGYSGNHCEKVILCGKKFLRNESHYNITSCPSGMTVGSHCSLKCEDGYKWTLEESVWTSTCALKNSNHSVADWDFENAPLCEI